MQQFTWYYKTHNKNTYSVTALGTTAIDDDQWHYIVGTSDNGIWKIYVDGVLEDTYNGDPGTFSNLDEPFYIGGFTGNYLDGCIKEVSLWNSVKTAVEIDIEFENYLGYSGSETNLKGYWKVDEGTLTNLNDLSSGNNDLTTQNSPTWVSENLVVAYSPDVIQWSDYYPFGSQLNGRHGSASDYRYGFNGMEKVDEITDVSGGHLDFGARIYDSRVGRWLSMDGITHYSQSPYTGLNDNPIQYRDPDGNEVIAPQKEAQQNILSGLTEKEQKYVKFNDDGTLNLKRLNKSKSTSTNFTSLKVLANSDIVYIYEVSAVDHNGVAFYDNGGNNYYKCCITLSDFIEKSRKHGTFSFYKSAFWDIKIYVILLNR